MECPNCNCEMRFRSRRRKVRSSEIEEEQYFCPKCFCYVVIRDGFCAWYDKNDNPLHASHDR